MILPVLCLSVFLVVVDNTIVNVALPTLNRHLGASITSLQWIVDAYSLAFAGLLLAGGGIGDRLGRKGTMQVGLVFFGLFSAAAAASHSTGTLIAARALMGVAAAFIFPASLAILTSIFTDPSERQKALGIWGATSGIAVAFGPITGGALLEHFWYGSIFLVNVPIVIVTLIAGQLLIPRLPRIAAHPFDVRGVVLSTVGRDHAGAGHHRGAAVGLGVDGDAGLLRRRRRPAGGLHAASSCAPRGRCSTCGSSPSRASAAERSPSRWPSSASSGSSS